MSSAPHRQGEASVPAPPRAPAPGPPDPRPDPAPDRGPSVGAMTLGVVLIGLGVVSLLATLGVDIPLHAVGSAILVVVGLGVLVSGIRGEPDNGGLGFAIFLGIVVVALSFVASVWEVPIAGGVGERVHTPTSAQAVEDDYRWGMGDMTVDLREVELATGTTELEVSVVMGTVEVIVPADMAVHVDAEVVAGSVDVLGHRVEGVGIDEDRQSAGFDDAGARLELVVRVGLGEAVVATR